MNFYYLLISIALSFHLDTDWHEYLSSQQDVYTIEIGHTYLNQTIYAYYIGDPNKPALLLDSLIHGNELATIHMNLHIFLQILQYARNGNEFYKYLIETNSIFTVPIINKDGYERNTRKNLKKTGVDLNRNFGYKFGNENFGSSPDPDSVEYRGDSAFSEPETLAIKQLVEEYDFRMAINIHCCANSILIPYSYDNVSVSDNFQEIYDDYQHKYGDYRIGKATDLVYQANGEAGDWMASEGILAITLEMDTLSGSKYMTEEEIDEVIEYYSDPMFGFVEYLPFHPILKNQSRNSNLIELIYYNSGLSEGINLTIIVTNAQLLNQSIIPLVNGREYFQLSLQVEQEASNVNVTIQYKNMNFNQRILEEIVIQSVTNIHAYQIVMLITFLLLVTVVIGEWGRNSYSNTDNSNQQMQLENEMA